MKDYVHDALSQQAEVRQKIRVYIVDNLLLGSGDPFADDQSLLEAGILDSTGAMELVAFLEHEFDFSINDDEITADNLDSVDHICALIARKCGHGNDGALEA